MKSLVIILVLVWSSFTKGNISGITHKKGYCIWYDQCMSDDSGALNCLYNGPAKTLNNTEGIALLNKLCPKFSQKRMTCCSTKQLEMLEKNLDLLRKLTSPCRSCWQNILDMFCELTCSPDQSLFVIPTQVIGFPPLKSILAVAYFVSMDFKIGLFESCKDVIFRGNDHPFSDICSTRPKTCPSQKFLENLSGTGFFDFKIAFPEFLPSNMTWVNDTSYPCNQSFVNPWINKTFDKCTCMDCSSSCGHQPRNVSRDPYDSPSYRKAVLKVTANSTYPQNHTGYHHYPDDKFIPFGPIFHLDLLNQALDLQLALTNLKVPYTKNNRTINITLDNVCYKPSSGDKCVIESVFQYFQNNKTRLNRCVTALGYKCSSASKGDFFKADYHDHFLLCASFPIAPSDQFWGGGPCLGENGLPSYSSFLLDGFNDTDYKMAKYLVISFVFKNHTDESKNEMARAWEKAFLSYMKEYVQNPRHSNLTITFSAKISGDHEKSTSSPTTTTPPTTTTTTTTTAPDVHSGDLRVIASLRQLLVILLAVRMLSFFILG